jgi:hypothetical protein
VLLPDAVWLEEPEDEPVADEPLVVAAEAALLEPETVVVTDVTLPLDALPVALDAEAVREPVADDTLGVAITLLSSTNCGV